MSITLDTSTIAFGTVNVGNQDQETVQFENLNAYDVRVSITIPEGYELEIDGTKYTGSITFIVPGTESFIVDTDGVFIVDTAGDFIEVVD